MIISFGTCVAYFSPTIEIRVNIIITALTFQGGDDVNVIQASKAFSSLSRKNSEKVKNY